MNKLVHYFLLTLVITGCGGGGGSSSTFNIQDTVGIWDSSNDYGQEGFDEFYLVINEDLSGADYDYLGDTFDRGSNCYLKDPFVIERGQDGLYRQQYDGFTIVWNSARVSGNSLTVTSGNASATIQREETLSVSDFEANLCDSEESFITSSGAAS